MGKHIIWVPLAILATLLAVLLWLGFQAHPQDTPESSPETTAALQEDQAAPPDPTDWRLMLVNPWNAIPQGYQPELVTVENGYQVDQRCASELAAMLADCRAAGYRPAICSAYRTQEKQAALYDTLVRKRMAQGLSQTEAQKQAATEVAVPGTSEHQRAPAGAGRGPGGRQLPGPGRGPGQHPRPAMADGALLGVWVHPALPRREAGHHRHHL